MLMGTLFARRPWTPSVGIKRSQSIARRLVQQRSESASDTRTLRQQDFYQQVRFSWTMFYICQLTDILTYRYFIFIRLQLDKMCRVWWISVGVPLLELRRDACYWAMECNWWARKMLLTGMELHGTEDPGIRAQLMTKTRGKVGGRIHRGARWHTRRNCPRPPTNL